MTEDLFYSPADPGHIKRERQKAREMRQSNWWRQSLSKGVCYYCEQKFSVGDLTMDHIVPIGRGGRSNPGNLVVSCKPCNTKKQSKTAAELALGAVGAVEREG